MGNERVHLVVHGRVQGVFYRASTQEKAIELGLAGWVRNRADGTVEVVAEGDREGLEKLVEWCRVGPERAQVTDVDINWESYTGEFREFTIKYRGR
ncbi:MAG: acylphosphatase [Deltaproteobacteria bacterium]|nr:acylphosphatase [Deltaproteobacteria bacterium]